MEHPRLQHRVHTHRNDALGREAPFEQQLRQRVLDALLDGALERPRSEHRIEPHLGQFGQGGGRHLQRQVHLGQPRLQQLQLDAGNRLDVRGVERMEHHGLVDAVQKLGAEVVLQLAPHGVLDVLGVLPHHGLDQVRADVARHHDHGVLEVHGAALAVGQAAVIQHLQQHVEHVRVGFFHLVKQQHGIRLAAHGLGQVAALLVAHVAGRRADQAGHGMLLHELAHVDADEVLLAVEQEARQRLAQLGLAHAGGAEEQERTRGAVRVTQARARTADGVGHGGDGLFLAHHALVQLGFHLQELVFLALHHLGHRNTRGTAHHLGDFFGAHLRTQQAVGLGGAILALFLGLGFLELTLQIGQLAVLQLGDLVEIPLALEFLDLQLDLLDLFAHVLAALGLGLLGGPDVFEVSDFLLQRSDLFLDQRQALLRGLVLFLLHGLALNLQLDQAAVELVHDLGLGVDLDLDLRSRLVDQVDGLVGQEAVGDVAVAQLGRSHDGRVGDLDAMVHFILFLQAAQDGDGGLHGGLAHQDLLEAALQRGVLLDVFAVFVERGRAHAVQLATRERGLEHVAGIHGALGLAGAHHGVQFVDEDDGLALILGQLIEHGFQAFLELATELGARQQRCHVERQHALALERFGHLAGHDALGQALDDGRLAHAGLADEHGVVLGAPLQHLDGAADLVVPADHGVELADAGALGQVDAVFLQRLALALGLGVVHLLAAAHGVDSGLEALAREAVFLGDARSLALAVDHGQQEQFAGDELVAALDGLFFGGLQHAAQFGSALHLVLALHGRQALHGGFSSGQQAGHIGSRTLQQRPGAVLLAQHGHEHVHRLDVRVVIAQRERLGVAQGFLELGGEFVETHGPCPPNCKALEAACSRFQDMAITAPLRCVSELPEHRPIFLLHFF